MQPRLQEQKGPPSSCAHTRVQVAMRARGPGEQRDNASADDTTLACRR